LPEITRHIPVAYSVIEEIVEDFVEGFWLGRNIRNSIASGGDRNGSDNLSN
jgi:hypothetical protein